VVIVSVHNSADTYGASRCLVSLFSLFVQEGHEVHIVLPGNGPLVSLLTQHGIAVHIHPGLIIIGRAELSSIRGRVNFLLKFPLSVLSLLLLILRVRADVVHTNTAVLPTPALAAVLTGRPHIWHIREFFSEFPFVWRFFQRYIVTLSDGIVAISHAVEEQFQPRNRSRCRVIYDGIEDVRADSVTAESLRSSFGGPTFLIGCVGRIKFLRKGQEVLVRAAARLRETHPDIHYAIVGSVSPGNEDHLVRLRELITSLDLDSRFHLLGELLDSRTLYPAFDLTVAPSVMPEPFGLVVTESMAAGVPVVGSRCGGIPEQIIDQQTGILFPANDHVALSKAIVNFISNKDFRLSAGKKSRLRFLDFFTIRKSYNQVAELFAQVSGASEHKTSIHPHSLGESLSITVITSQSQPD
jgi:glycosyltransferase involved in cell wall biosynthesis